MIIPHSSQWEGRSPVTITRWQRASTELAACQPFSVSGIEALTIFAVGLQEPSAVSLWLSISLSNLIKHPDNTINR